MTKTISYPVVCLGHSKGIWEVSFSNEGNSFVSACHDNVPVVRNATSGEWISNLNGHSGAVWSAKFDDTGTLIATGAADLMAKVWSTQTQTCIHEFPHKHVVRSVCFSPDSRYLATGCYDFLIRIFDLQHPKNPPREIVNGKDRVMKVHWSLDGKSIFSADHAGTLRKWNVDDLSCLKEVTLPSMEGDKESAVTDMHYVKIDTKMLPIFENTLPQHNKWLLCATSGRTVSFVDDVSFEIVHTIMLSANAFSATIHPTYSRFLVAGAGMDIVIYDLYHKKEIFVHKGHHGNIHSLRFSPNGEILVTGADDATVRLWKFSDLLQQNANNESKAQSVYTPQTDNQHVPQLPAHEQDPPQSSVKAHSMVQNQHPRPQVRDYYHGPGDNFAPNRQEHYSHANHQPYYSAASQTDATSHSGADYPDQRSVVLHSQRGGYEKPPNYADPGYPHPNNASHRRGHWPPIDHGTPPLDAHYLSRNDYMMSRDPYGKLPPNGYHTPVHHQRPSYPHHPQEYGAPQHTYSRSAPHPHLDYRDYARHPVNPNYPYPGPTYHESASRPTDSPYRGYDASVGHRNRMAPSDSNDMYPHEYKYPHPSYSKPEYPSSAPDHYMPQYSSMESPSYSQHPQSIRGRSAAQNFAPMHDTYNGQYSRVGPNANGAHYPPQSDGRMPVSGYPGAYPTSAAATSYR